MVDVTSRFTPLIYFEHPGATAVVVNGCLVCLYVQLENALGVIVVRRGERLAVRGRSVGCETASTPRVVGRIMTHEQGGWVAVSSVMSSVT